MSLALFRKKHPPDAVANWLHRGQSFEATGTDETLIQAVACYDEAIALLQPHSRGDASHRRRLAIAWMNRGNALQKQAVPAKVQAAVQAYDEAIGLLQTVLPNATGDVANNLGAAWLNRGHALLQLADASCHSEAIRSLEQAVDIFIRLPVDTSIAHRLNLAGAQTNLAHALLDTLAENRWLQAHAAAESALQLTAGHEQCRVGFAEIGLKARRVLCEIIGQWLLVCEPARTEGLVARASDVVDAGMALARRWEALDVSVFRPLATRLFRFGAAFYRRHQPHFLADFILENLAPRHAAGACPADAEWRDIAGATLAATREDLRTKHLVIADSPATHRRLQTLREIEAALTRLSLLPATDTTAAVAS